jgi:phosphatidylglycerol---prolipoprotein diacylglyceryl transferase
VSIAAVVFDFDPFVQLLGDLTIRWGAIALAVVIAAALILAGVLARGAGLRGDDVVFITVGIVPGAVIGGRLGYLLLHPALFEGDLGRIFDPSVGGLELGLAVVGGFITGVYVAGLLGASVGRWLHVAAAPLLFAIGAGKLTMVLTGSGQGVPSDAAWATAYAGPGPWGSLVPALPSVPSQALEGGATLAILAVLALVLIAGGFAGRDGRLFFVGVGLWAVARAAVSTTWRDGTVVAGLGIGGIVALGIAAVCALAVIWLSARGRTQTDGPKSDVSWPEPEARPRF